MKELIHTCNNSSIVASVKFSPSTKIITVNYITTGNYKYYECTEEEYKEIIIAHSVGKQVRITLKGKEFKKF